MAPPGDGRLFLETDVPLRLAYERSVLQYCVSSDRDEGMRACLEALAGPHETNVRENMKFYAKRLRGEATRLNFPVPEGFYSSSISVNEHGLANIRCVDYFIEPNGGYRHFGAGSSPATSSHTTTSGANSTDSSRSSRPRSPLTNRGVTVSRTSGSATTAPSRDCLLYTSPSPRDRQKSRMPSSA